MFAEKVHNEACTYGLFLTLTCHEDAERSSDFTEKLKAHKLANVSRHFYFSGL